MSDTNEIPGLGHNAPPDYAQIEAERLGEEYVNIVRTVEELMEEAKAAPKEVNDDETAGILGKLVKRLRDTTAQIKAYHAKEKEPHYRKGQAVDRFFFGMHERLARRQKTDNPGAADVLEGRIDKHNQRKLAEERRKREEAARLAREEEDRLRRQREEIERQQREAEQAAARARNAENIKKQEEEARRLAAEAEALRAKESVAIDKRQETQQAATAKPADMSRTRLSDDVLMTMKQEAYAEVVDFNLLDKAQLIPFVDDAAWEKALKAWAKVTQHKRQMEGALIGFRDKTVIR